MGTLSEEVRQRKNALRGVNKTVRNVATAAKAVQRLINRLVNRKQSLPDEKDLLAVIEAIMAIGRVWNSVSSIPDMLREVFRIG
jgi:hypothetical protein